MRVGGGWGRPTVRLGRGVKNTSRRWNVAGLYLFSRLPNVCNFNPGMENYWLYFFYMDSLAYSILTPEKHFR